ncbi:MAG: DUF6708 domain-containing protein, partial [Pseudomonas sp.]|uniref:DUF6708 domain-containing protein n=1 Tax=Pseudomonas sp. TaxID=306 RepID=UPI003D6FF414
MAFTEPLLDPHAPGWKRDLPMPDQTPSTEPYPPVLSNPPNHVDPVYLELRRSTIRTRGAGPWIAMLVFVLTCYPLSSPLEIWNSDWVINLIIPVVLVIGVWSGVYIWRMDVDAPRDEPIRFNRLRRKVYVYR